MKQLQRSEMEVLDAPIQMMNHNHHVIWAAVLKSFKYYHTLHTILDGPASSNKAYKVQTQYKFFLLMIIQQLIRLRDIHFNEIIKHITFSYILG